MNACLRRKKCGEMKCYRECCTQTTLSLQLEPWCHFSHKTTSSDQAITCLQVSLSSSIKCFTSVSLSSILWGVKGLLIHHGGILIHHAVHSSMKECCRCLLNQRMLRATVDLKQLLKENLPLPAFIPATCFCAGGCAFHWTENWLGEVLAQ